MLRESRNRRELGPDVVRELALYYAVYMGTTITVRASDELRKALARKAAAGGKTISELVREILEAAVEERPLESRVGHLRGRLGAGGSERDAWRRRLRERNWRG
jgi:plasmid stability protein